MTTKLERTFEGKGEVSGYLFLQQRESDKGYIYSQLNKETGAVFYEVFYKKSVPVCIDFENKIYSETDFKEVYPRSKDFGKWAWTFSSFADAMLKLELL